MVFSRVCWGYNYLITRGAPSCTCQLHFLGESSYRVVAGSFSFEDRDIWGRFVDVGKRKRGKTKLNQLLSTTCLRSQRLLLLFNYPPEV